MIRFASLGSGSEGNGLVVECGHSRLLLDCGFGIAETVRRLGRLDVAPESLDAVLVTHEHADHVGGAARFARRHDLPVYLSHGTWAAAGEATGWGEVVVIGSHQSFAIGDIEVQPFPVPHDAREPTQFVFGDGSCRLGVLTDTGMSTPHIEQTLSGVQGLVLECNHDAAMLRDSAYPESLKARIGGRLGHLENAQAAQILSALDRTRLQHVVAAHLSQKNNQPRLAAAALSAVLGCSPDWIGIATQDEGLAWREIR
jgi:phosphoribosyl 1,2-cyclic phosphodiesterase